ncbi:MAG TPA: protoporphyrinogen oxidase [Gemmatimonadales bacterium]|nr:protoporphyrinogen oxidase [Gemmatimonadales bacterium]
MASVAVIGAGVTGLTAAFCLKQRGTTVVVYEAGDRVGGVIRSERQGGYVAELGPSSMSAPSAAAANLFSDLGLESSIVYASPEVRNRYIVRRGKLVRLPLAPAELLTSRLLSNSAKLAVFGEPLVETGDSPVDESVAAFVRRRFNQEVLDYVVNPFIAGTFAGDPEQLSVRHGLPQLQALERAHGSVMRAYLKGAKAQRNPDDAGAAGGLISFRNGLQELTDALGRELKAEIRFRSPVTQIRTSPKGWTVGAAFQSPELYDAVIFAAPSHAIDDIDLDLSGAERLATLSSIIHPPVAVLAFGFGREQVAHPLDGFGFLTPEVERRRVLGVIFSSTLFPGRAPAGHVLLTAFAGGTRDPDFVHADPHTLAARVLDELRMLLGTQGEPTFRSVQVWPKAIPQYVLGYGRFKDIAEQAESNNPGLALAGTYRDGVALGEAIASGAQAASRIGKFLGIEPVAGGIPAAGLH